MNPAELDIGGAAPLRRARPRKAALEGLERLLRAHAALSEQRDPESPYGILRPGSEAELALIEAVFLHCGVPLPDTLRAIYRRTLGVGNPVSPLPVLGAPFLQATLPDEGFGSPIVGIEAFERDLGVYRDELSRERPPVLHLGHAAPAGLAVSRNGLWSIQDYQGYRELAPTEDFNLVFETAFCAFVDQVLVLWANDLAGALISRRDLAQGVRLGEVPAEFREAMSRLLAPRSLSPRTWGDIQPHDNPDLTRATRRPQEDGSGRPLGSHLAVVGLPYVDHPEIVARIGPGDLLRLHPVDDNPHDPNAVEVWHDGETSVRVGFIERKDAARVRALPPDPSSWRLRVTERSDRVLVVVLEISTSDVGDSQTAVSDCEEERRLDHPQDLFTK